MVVWGDPRAPELVDPTQRPLKLGVGVRRHVAVWPKRTGAGDPVLLLDLLVHDVVFPFALVGGLARLVEGTDISVRAADLAGGSASLSAFGVSLLLGLV